MRRPRRATSSLPAAKKAVFQKTDVTDSAQVQALVTRAVAEFGGLDVAFNNAGLLPPTTPFAEQTENDWNRIMSVDVSGVFLCLKHELAHMAKAGRGAIVNTASVAGLRADPGMARAPFTSLGHSLGTPKYLPKCPQISAHSHSMVAGGLLEIS
nr:SDR family NAD(P)-dependent oxidoreductase [Gammaproteobacteria bacterium]